MPRPFPAEFRLRAVALVRAGKPITTAAVQLGVSAAALHKWVRQDQIDRGERPGITTPETAELSRAKKRIRQTRNRSRDPEDCRKAPWGRSSRPKRIHLGIDRLIEAGYRAKQCCRLLGVRSPGCHRYKNRAISPTQMRRLWLTGFISEVHIASRQTYGSRRIHAELTIGMKLQVRKASGGCSDEQSWHSWPSRAREGETAAWHRDRR